MDLNNSVVVAAGALLVGVLVGYSLSGSGDELAEQGLARTEALSAQVEAMGAKVDGLDQKVGGIESAVADLGGKQAESLKGIGDQLAGLGGAVGGAVTGAVDKLGAGVTDTVKTQIDGLREQIAALRAGGEGSGAAAPAPAPAKEEAAAGGGEAAGGWKISDKGTAVTPGMAAIIAPEKLHVFLSAADPAAGSATVAVNGQSLSTILVGQKQEANGCEFSLTGFDEKGAAMIDGGC